MRRQAKWRSLVAFRATVALVLFVIKNYFHYEIPHIDSLVELVAIGLVAYGIYNDPGDPIKY